MTTHPDILENIFPGDSEMSRLMRAHDWAATPLGPVQTWPVGLKVALRMMLTSRFEMWLGWGPDMAFFYNDAYRPTLGVKHPNALGRPTREVWREIYSDVEGRFKSVMEHGVSTWDKALLLLLERSGYPEETYHTFSYSPLISDAGVIEGLLCVVSEETERVITERRLETLRTLTTALLPVRTRQDIAEAVNTALRTNTHDFPFSFLHFFDQAEPEGPLGQAAWPFKEARIGLGRSITLPLDGILQDPPRGAWAIPPREAVVHPLYKAAQRSPVGALVLGLNPYRGKTGDIKTGDIESFLQLISTLIAGALNSVDSYAQEAEEIARLQALFEQSPSFIAVLRGPAHRYELVNAQYTQLIGHRDVLGKSIRDALPEIEGQGFYELLDSVYLSGKPYIGQSVPVMLQRSAGAPPEGRYVDFVYQPTRDQSGEINGIFVEGIDVTEAHDAVAALRESEQQFRTLAEAMLNHVWTATPDGNLDWFNSRVYEYSGTKPGELDGSNWATIVHRDDLEAAGNAWAVALASGNTYEAEFRLRNAGGSYRWHIARAVALRNEDNVIVRWIGTNTDIHEQVTVTQSLADLNATLEEQVTERTNELMAAEASLRQSQKMEAVGQLTGGIAHDFNNLLAGITGSLELLATRIAQGRLDAAPRYMDAARSAANRAAALTQRLLAFSRRQTLDARPVNVNKLVGEMEDLIRRTAGPGISLEVVGAGGVWTVLVDANQLENALLNLCINARDAMPDGGRITIETANKWLDDRAARERDLAPGQYVSLCVTDTGTGMTEEVISRAFDPFFTTKPLGQGTGLGLSMIYGFIRQSGGQVRIYSELGSGTTMCLYLPRYTGVEADDQAAKMYATPDFTGHGETVLVVDDEPMIRMLIVDVLEEAGYKAIEANDGAAGLKILQSDTRIDLMITDVGLPGGMNGRQVADAGRALRPGLKVLFITGYAENAVVSNGHLDQGMQVMTKPFAVEMLGNKIREMIDG
ncbi:MAG: hybrid sensor histidine kinase/response regulator [Rhizobium sp.]|nr:hybrid sensor histidine kinase/response regulator [Rhizobium sp.]